MEVVTIVYLLVLVHLGASQIYPGSYELNVPAVSERGSSATGHCSNVSDSGRVCNAPRSSVLFDGIPTLTGLEGDMWASQLLTLNTSTSSANITFDFTNPTDRNGPVKVYAGVGVIEVVMFNCPARGIGARSMSVNVVDISIDNIAVSQSCEYLVRACSNDVSTLARQVTLNFINQLQHVYLAEVTFYTTSRPCSPIGPINTSVITTPATTPGLTSGSSFPGSSETSTLISISSTTSETVMTTTSIPISSSNTGAIVAVVTIVLLISIAIGVVLVVLILMYLIRNGTIRTKHFVYRKQTEAQNVMYSKNPINPEYEDIGDEDNNVKLGRDDDNQTARKSISPVVTVQYEDIDILAPVKKQPSNKDGEIASANNDVTASDKLKTPKLGSNVTSTQYEDIDELTPFKTFSKNANEKRVSEYEDMDNLPFQLKQEGDKNILPLDSNEYNKLSFGKKERRQTYDPSDTTYSHLDSAGIDNSARARSDTLPAVYSVVNKKPSETSKDTSTIAEESNAVAGGSNKSNLPPPIDTAVKDSISDIARKRSDTVPASYTPENVPPPKPGRRHTQNATIKTEGKPLPDKSSDPSLPPSKPSRQNTKSRLSDALSESAPPPIPEKSKELDCYLNNKGTPYKNERSIPESDATPGLTTSSFNDNPDYSDIGNFSDPSEQDKSVSMENIYESIHTEPIKPSLFTPSQDNNKNEEELCPYSSIYETAALPLSQEKPLEVSMKNISEEKTLGAGQFGKVILAKTVGLSEAALKLGESTKKKFSVRVAVKLLKSSASETSKKQFEKEYRFMFKLNHPNVIRMLGICTEKPPFIMMEYMENGDLNEILKHQYSSIVESDVMPGDGEITVKTLIHICTQVASGLNYLATHNCIHRDIATRNCLVGEDFLVKIADFGMSRSLYDSHYYVVKGRALLPVRWMAFECYYGRFSAKSDVWAFGCTMWEVFDLAKNEPYFEMADQQVVEDALLGPERKLPSHSEGCPDSVYQVMKLCWAHEPSERATFDQLHSELVHLNI